MQAAANVKGSMPAGNGRKVLAHYVKKLKEGGYPEKAADKQFADYTDRELDALFDLSVDEYDKMVEDAYNEVRAWAGLWRLEQWGVGGQVGLSPFVNLYLLAGSSRRPIDQQNYNDRSAPSRCRPRRSRA